jgi:hypothetical protein
MGIVLLGNNPKTKKCGNRTDSDSSYASTYLRSAEGSGQFKAGNAMDDDESEDLEPATAIKYQSMEDILEYYYEPGKLVELDAINYQTSPLESMLLKKEDTNYLLHEIMNDESAPQEVAELSEKSDAILASFKKCEEFVSGHPDADTSDTIKKAARDISERINDELGEMGPNTARWFTEDLYYKMIILDRAYGCDTHKKAIELNTVSGPYLAQKAKALSSAQKAALYDNDNFNSSGTQFSFYNTPPT